MAEDHRVPSPPTSGCAAGELAARLLRLGLDAVGVLLEADIVGRALSVPVPPVCLADVAGAVDLLDVVRDPLPYDVRTGRARSDQAGLVPP